MNKKKTLSTVLGEKTTDPKEKNGKNLNYITSGSFLLIHTEKKDLLS